MRNLFETALLTPTLVLALSMSALAGPLEDAYGAYERGDYATAVLLFRPLAEQGNAQAQAQLGFMFNAGRGVSQDYEQAAAWYRRSAEGGNAAGQYNLAVMYDKGHGVPQDWVLAHKWLILATANAPRQQRDYYARIRDAVAFKLTPAQIDEAQDLANAWRPVRER